MRLTRSASRAEQPQALFRILEKVSGCNKGPLLGRLDWATGLQLLLQCTLLTSRGQNTSQKTACCFSGPKLVSTSVYELVDHYWASLYQTPRTPVWQAWALLTQEPKGFYKGSSSPTSYDCFYMSGSRNQNSSKRIWNKNMSNFSREDI